MAVTMLKSHTDTYEVRLQELSLDSLEEMRKQGDLAGKDNVDPTTWFTTSHPLLSPTFKPYLGPN